MRIGNVLLFLYNIGYRFIFIIKDGTFMSMDYSDRQESREELQALASYMAKHNISHTEELKGLAEKLLEQGDREAYEKFALAIAEYEKGNALLTEALKIFE